jgi:tripartite-type tricarboxylate transporter receptor subunit TctC
MRSGDMIGKLAALGAEPETTTPEEYAARLRNDVARWREVIRGAKITAQ